MQKKVIKYNKKNKLLADSKPAKVIIVIAVVLFMIYALSLIYPFVWAFINSLKDNPEYWDNPMSLPNRAHFSNYVLAFTELKVAKSNPLEFANMFEMLWNSVWFTFGGALINIFTTAMFAYVISKYNFIGKRFLYVLGIFVMIIPVVGGLPATLKVLYGLRLVNTPLFLITTIGNFGFNFIMLHAYFENISGEYMEAAYIDGAGNWKVFVKIMLPQAIPMFVILIIITSIGRWNDYMTPLIYLQDYPTLSTGLFVFQFSSLMGNQMPIYFAGLLLTTLPILIVFIVFQDVIMTNFSVGGIKG